MTALIAVITEASVERIRSAARRSLEAGADRVEVRLDHWSPGPTRDDLAAIGQALVGISWIATYRSISEGGRGVLGSQQVAEILEAARVAGASVIDVEADRDLGLLTETVQDGSCEDPVIHLVSRHRWAERRAGLSIEEEWADLDRVSGVARVQKLAVVITDMSDNLSMLDACRGRSGRRMGICMGEKGLLTRILAAKMGSWGSFAAVEEDEPAAPGQVSVGQMAGLYRWRSLGPRTRLFGVIGSPVAHSLSPVLFNEQFGRMGYDGVYLPLRIDTETELRKFLDGCLERDWLDVRGFSVTVPHKEAALRWVGAGVDERSLRVGAVNTLIFDEGRVTATNTDYEGARQAIRASLAEQDQRGNGVAAADGPTSPSASGRLARANSTSDQAPPIPPSGRVLVLGAGGVARAIVAMLVADGWNVGVCNRTRGRAERLVAEFGGTAVDWRGRSEWGCDLVVNCTSVGMWPDIDATPMPAGGLRRGMVIFETVYRPAETRLVREARDRGCGTITGAAMFVAQASAQYRIWTGQEPDIDVMTATVNGALASDNEG